MKKGLIKILLIIVLVCAMAAPAMAEKVLRWASQGDALTYDPMSQNEGPTISASRQIYETLIIRNYRQEKEPCLATSWKVLDPKTWEFKLRQGIKFHDGTPFTAEDVVFSFKRAMSPTSEFKGYIPSVVDVKAIDNSTVHLMTSGPNPIMPDQVTNIFIMSKKWCENHNAVQPQNFKEKQEMYTVRNANGTGPFKLELREPDIKTIVMKNPTWWRLKENPHNIDRIIYTPITNAATRVAALLSGEVDFVLDPPFQDLARISASPNLKTQQISQIRTIFYGLDQGSAELRSSNIKGKNPFKDKRVRQAINMAIDRSSIQKVVMRGLSVPAAVITAPGVHGYPQELDKKLPPLDLEKAKRLLAEAGYPNGFEVAMDVPNDRYNNDEAIGQATVGMLGKIGIKVKLVSQSKSLHFPKISKRTSDFYMLGWGVPTLDSAYVFSYLYQKDGQWNATGYDNPRVNQLTKEINVETNLPKRDAMIAEVWKIVNDDVVYIPLHHQVIVWAMKKNLELPIDAQDAPQFRFGRIQ
jgi:peptide/nickel transport system substrate-binding protein